MSRISPVPLRSNRSHSRLHSNSDLDSSCSGSSTIGDYMHCSSSPSAAAAAASPSLMTKSSPSSHRPNLTGRCPQCNTRTHRMVNKGVYGRRRELLPLTVSGSVCLGRCLKCTHPSSSSSPSSSPAAAEAAPAAAAASSPRSALDVSEFDGGEDGGVDESVASTASSELLDASQSTIEPEPTTTTTTTTPSKLLDASTCASRSTVPSYQGSPDERDDEQSLASVYSSIVLRLSQNAPPPTTGGGDSPPREVGILSDLSKMSDLCRTDEDILNASAAKDDDADDDEAQDEEGGGGGGVCSDILRHIDTLNDPSSTSHDVHKSCSALRRVAVDNRTVIAAYGGVRAVVSAMIRHQHNVAVQKAACGIMQNLACTYETDHLVSAEGGITAIVHAMRSEAGRSSAGLQGYGCAALRNLALKCGQNRTVIAREGGLDVVVAAMRAHSRDGRVQETGCAALANLCIRNAENRVVIGEELDGVMAVLAAVRNFGIASPGVAEKAMKALLNLSYHPGNVDKLTSLRGIEDLLLGVGVKHGGRCKEWAVRLWLRF